MFFPHLLYKLRRENKVVRDAASGLAALGGLGRHINDLRPGCYSAAKESLLSLHFPRASYPGTSESLELSIAHNLPY